MSFMQKMAFWGGLKTQKIAIESKNPQSDIHALESIDDSPDDPDDCNFEFDWNPPAHHYTKHETSEELALQ